MNNCDPQLVSRCYMEYLLETKIMPSMLRIDHSQTMQYDSWLIHRSGQIHATTMDLIDRFIPSNYQDTEYLKKF